MSGTSASSHDVRTAENNEAALRRLVVHVIAFAKLESLERAKGLEPSTPTLARSCSTTELHPHPCGRRWLAGNRETYAKSGPRMQQPESPAEAAERPISAGVWRKTHQNTSARAL